jgi:hypothetical protein
MGQLSLDYEAESIGLYEYPTLSKEQFERFNMSILGLGSIPRKAPSVEALAAIFDLAGFTKFCNQIDPHLVVPEFLSRFLKWLFGQVAIECTYKEYDERVAMWCQLPFYAKFLGDGILLLWDTDAVRRAVDIGNIVVSLFNICNKYRKVFLPSISLDVDNPPKTLRCGIARGQVISLGGGSDFVGSCINVASRMQKMSELNLAFPRRGFDPKRCFTSAAKSLFILKKASVRGIEGRQLIMISKEEFQKLPMRRKADFQDIRVVSK